MRQLLVTLLCLAAAVPMARAQVLRVAELNTSQIRALDRARTAVILPGGILEQHGPYLPSYTDGYGNERITRILAEGIVARPGWAALLFPVIPLGSGAANEIGRNYAFPGSYTVRSSTVRAIFMDLADSLGEQGFRWVFVVHGHGSPHNNLALDDAGDYFHETYGGRMVHLLGVLDVIRCCGSAAKLIGPEAAREDGFTVHAGLGETSSLLFLRPDLVPDSVRAAPSVTGADMAGLVELARKPGWPGYFGAPRHATAAIGAAAERDTADAALAFALKVLDGFDPATAPRYADAIARDAAIGGIMKDTFAREAAAEARHRDWLRSRPPSAARAPGSN